MSKLYWRFVCLILVMACLFGTLGADVEPFDFDTVADEEITETSESSEITSEMSEETPETDADLDETGEEEHLLT